MSKYKYVDPDYEPKGAIAGFPLHVIDAMIEQQVLQGNEADVSVFEKINHADKNGSGFSWSQTKQGMTYWSSVISNKKFDKVPIPEPPSSKEEIPYEQALHIVAKALDKKPWKIRIARPDEKVETNKGNYSLPLAC